MSFEYLSKTNDVNGTKVWCDFICKPPITHTRVEIDNLKSNGYDYATDGHSEIFTIIYSDKESASLEEIESLLKMTRVKIASSS